MGEVPASETFLINNLRPMNIVQIKLDGYNYDPWNGWEGKNEVSSSEKIFLKKLY